MEPHLIVMFNPIAVSMADLSDTCLRWPKLREALALLAMTAMGMVGNFLNAELFFGVNFLFGSIATIIAVRSSGALWGTVVGLAVGSYSYVLWGHPYAIIVFGMEALFIGLLTCFIKNSNVILIDVVYWALLGCPLVWVLHSYQLGLPESAVTLLAVKQAANGITNAVVAVIFIQFTPIIRWISGGTSFYVDKNWSIRTEINTAIALFIFIPMMGVMIVQARESLQEMQATLEYDVQVKAADTGRELASILRYYSNFLAMAAELELDNERGEFWKNYVSNFGDPDNPAVINTEIVRADGEILFSYPENRTGVSEYASQLSYIPPGSYQLSSVRVDEVLGVPYFTMILPISRGHLLVASFSVHIFMDQLARISLRNPNIELLDGQGYIVGRTGTTDLSAMVQGNDPRLLLPSDTKLPSMVRWRDAYWQDSMLFISDSDWVVRVSTPMKKSIDTLQVDYIEKFLTMIILSIVSVLFVPLVSRTLSSPLRELTVAADMFTNSIKREDVIWPTSNILEVNALVNQFQEFVQVINEKQLALSQSKAQQQRIASELIQFIDTANAPIFGIDGQGNINEWNQQAKKITGFTKQEVMGLALVDNFIADDYKLSVGGILAQALQGVETANYEFSLLSKSGKKIDILLNSTTRRNVTGEIVGVVGVGKDITELNRIQHEQEVERKQAAAILIQSSRLATLGEMATSVAHELNQPLNVIRMAAGNSRRKMSEGTADSDYLSDKLLRIEEQTARAAAIIDHMRMFGREATEPAESIDLRKVVLNALDLMGEQLRLARVEVVTLLVENCACVLGHTIQMEQVILNLLANALDAIYAVDESEGGAKITLQVFEGDKVVCITVQDTGGGIASDVLGRIFEPFYTTKEIGQGTGLGLSVSYGIVRDMKGTIIAENIDDGARFTITLPMLS
jgi:PAS domain S-box-containing protein